MKFTHVGKYRVEVLDEPQDHQPREFADRLLRNFDHLLGTVKEQQPQSLAEYVTNLEAHYSPLLKRKHLTLKKADVAPFIEELVHLRDFPQLARIFLNYHFQLLELPKGAKWNTEKTKVTQRAFLRSFLVLRYRNLQVLTETLPRDTAIQLFKGHIDDYVRWRLENQDDRFQTLEELRQDWLQMETEDTGSEGVVSEVEDGKLILRKECCHWDVALEDLTDRELKYITCCYGDFESVRTYNKSFALTMDHTIVRGDPYCSCVYYDTRITKELTHPSKEFFDSIWPLADRE